MEEQKEKVLAFIEDENYVPMKAKEIADLMCVPKEEYASFIQILKELTDEYKICVNRKSKYSPIRNTNYKKGIIRINEKGFGFVKIEGEEEEIFVFVEEFPSFPGGEEALYKYLYDNLQYPDMARDNNITGKVVIRFVVEKDGSITKAAIAREIGGGCGKEALRVVNGMPKWKPGKQSGKAVRTEFTLPVDFQLN